MDIQAQTSSFGNGCPSRLTRLQCESGPNQVKAVLFHHFLQESRIWLQMTSLSEDGNACQPELSYFFLSAGVRKSPLGGFGIYVPFNLKCYDLCCNLFLFSLIFALLMDPSAECRISACAFFFFRHRRWC